jgi:uncharacterized protein
MAVIPTYPGIYIEEIPSGTRTITEVATSIAAFIGTFQRGPLYAAVQVFNKANFETQYGGYDAFSEASYAVEQFFLNGGQQAWILRIAETQNAPQAQPATWTLNSAGTAVYNVGAGRQVLGQSVSDPGAWGNNLRLEIDYLTADPSLFNLTVSEVAVNGDRTTVVGSQIYPSLSFDVTKANNAVAVVNQASQLVQLSLPNPLVPPTARPDSNGTLGLPLPVALGAFPAENDPLDITIAGTATPTISLTGKQIHYGGSVPQTYAGLRPFIEATIRSAASDPAVPPGLRPLLSNATVDLVGANTAQNQARFFVRLGRNARPFDPSATITLGNTVAAVLGVQLFGAGVTVNPQQAPPAAPGSDGPPPAPGTTFRPVQEKFFSGNAAAKTGMHALENADLFNILCIPEATTLSASDRQALYTEAEVYCEGRRAMLIVDIPAAVNRLDLMQTWMSDNDGLRHPNAVVYFPRTSIPDPLNLNRPRSVPSSGTIAGLWARTDVQGGGVWKAPAGTDAQLRNVVSLDYLLTDSENGALNPIGVNCLRSLPIYQNICWGARTLEGADILASDWKYVPVRRLTLFLEESLYRGTKWVVFQPNDEPLWSEIRRNVGSFMQDLFRKKAFQGTSPQQAYFVKCDNETTTQRDVDKGVVNIEVGFAPLKPAEFVILKIQQIAPATPS